MAVPWWRQCRWWGTGCTAAGLFETVRQSGSRPVSMSAACLRRTSWSSGPGDEVSLQLEAGTQQRAGRPVKPGKVIHAAALPARPPRGTVLLSGPPVFAGGVTALRLGEPRPGFVRISRSGGDLLQALRSSSLFYREVAPHLPFQMFYTIRLQNYC